MCVCVSCIIYLQSLKVISWSWRWCTGLYQVFTNLPPHVWLSNSDSFASGALKCFHRCSGDISALIYSSVLVESSSSWIEIWNEVCGSFCSTLIFTHFVTCTKKMSDQSLLLFLISENTKANKTWLAMWPDSFECINKMSRLLLLLWRRLKRWQWYLKVKQKYWCIELGPSSWLVY